MDNNELLLKMAIDAWNAQLNRASKFFDAHTDDQLKQAVAPNRNSGVYLLGHLVAVHDAMLPLLGLGDRLFPTLENIFIKNPDNAGLEKPSAETLRADWKKVNEKLADSFAKMNMSDWLQKHSAVSEADFAKEPHRNKLNVLLSRTSHIAYHLGQLAFL